MEYCQFVLGGAFVDVNFKTENRFVNFNLRIEIQKSVYFFIILLFCDCYFSFRSSANSLDKYYT